MEVFAAGRPPFHCLDYFSSIAGLPERLDHVDPRMQHMTFWAHPVMFAVQSVLASEFPSGRSGIGTASHPERPLQVHLPVDSDWWQRLDPAERDRRFTLFCEVARDLTRLTYDNPSTEIGYRTRAAITGERCPRR